VDEPGASDLVSVLDPNEFKNEHQKVPYITSQQLTTEIDEEKENVFITLLCYFQGVKKEKFAILES